MHLYFNPAGPVLGIYLKDTPPKMCKKTHKKLPKVIQCGMICYCKILAKTQSPGQGMVAMLPAGTPWPRERRARAGKAGAPTPGNPSRWKQTGENWVDTERF